jgi:hypothetical protein
MPMRCGEIRRELCGGGTRFSMAMSDLKDRLGVPESIRILPRWCRDTGRDVVVLSYRAADGRVEVFCPITLIQGEEHAIDGWLTVQEQSPRSPQPPARLPTTQPRLFD